MKLGHAVLGLRKAVGATKPRSAYPSDQTRSQTLTGPRQRAEPYEDITDYTVILLRLILLALLIGFNGGPL